MRQVFKVLKWIGGIILITMLLLWGTLQTEAGQNFVVDKITNSLSSTLNTKVAIGQVRFKFFKSIEIENIFIADQEQDTLAALDQLSASIGLFSLLNQTIRLDNIQAKGLTAKLHNTPANSTFNYQFILDAFANPNTSTELVDTTSGATWTIGLGTAQIEQIQFSFQDSVQHQYLSTFIQEVNLDINHLDLAQQTLDVQALAITKPIINFETQVAPTSIDTSRNAPAILFPYTGWQLKATDLMLEMADLRYWINNRPVPKDIFDATHLHVKNLDLNLSDFHWDASLLQADLDRLNFQERSGLSLDKMQTKFSLTPEKIALSELQINTAYSTIQNTTQLNLKNWNGLSDFLNEVTLETQFSDSRLAIEDLNFFLPYIPQEYRINKPIFLNGKIFTKNQEVRLSELQLEMGNILTLHASSTFKNITNLEQLTANIAINQLKLDYPQLRKALPVLNLPLQADSLGIINFSGGFVGNLKNIDLQNLILSTSTNTLLKANGRINNFNNVHQLSYDLQIDSLQSRAEDIAYFTSTPLASGLYELQDFFYKGTLRGDLYDIKSKGLLNTAIGQLQTNIAVDFNQDYSNAVYDGFIGLSDFDLGTFLGDTTTFGKVSLDATVKGSGISRDSLQTTLAAQVNTIGLLGYQYDSINIDGRIEQLKFTGLANIQDENLSFDFKGLFNLNEEIPVFEFDLILDTLDLAALQLAEDSIRTSFRLKSNFQGTNINDFLGYATIEDLHLSNIGKHFQTDSLQVTAKKIKSQDKILSLRSDVLNATISGDFNLSTLPNRLANFVHDYFPLDQLSPPDSLQKSDLPDQRMAFDIQLLDIDPLLALFVPALTELPLAQCKGNIDTRSKDLTIRLKVPTVTAANWQVDSLEWLVKGDASQLQSNLSIPKLSDQAMSFQQINITNSIFDQSIQTNIYANNAANSPIFEWGALVKPKAQNYQLLFNDSLKINNLRWDISDQHEILFSNNFLKIKDFFLEKNYQSIAVNTGDTPNDQDYTPIEINFNGFELSELSAFTKLEGFDFDGLLNGNIVLNDINKNLHYFADLNITNLIVNDSLIGRFDIFAQQKPNAPIIDLSVGLTGNTNKLLAKGIYNIQTTALDIQTDIEQIPLLLGDPFSDGAIQNSSGYLSGALAITGTANQPDVNGQLNFNEAATQINYLKTRYQIPSGTITLNKQRIDFGKLPLVDLNGNEAELSGHIAHNFFQDIQFNLNFDTDKFRFLNTAFGDNELFYGTLYMGAQVEIRGRPDLPRITVTATTLPESLINVSALLEEGEVQQADYIIFGKPEERSLDSVLLQQNNAQYKTPEVDLLLNLKLTEQAELVIIIDPNTGDQLSCKGNADLKIQLSPNGKISINGVYKVVSGAYQFNYEGLVKRSFELEPGSQLNFIGDPLDTRFNVTAAYRTRTNIYSLIGNEASLSASAERQAKKRSDVKVLLNMNGDLNQPEISFDLAMEDLNSSVSSILEQKLVRLREDEAELNKQVFGLLLLNSFVSEQSATAGISTAGENIALSSVSGLISNQLNRLSERYLKGVGLTFDLESYSSQFNDESDATTRTNLNVGLTRSIFNDRVRVKVGGVVQVNDSGGDDSNRLSNIAGDFVLEYQIDQSGNYILRVFQKSDYDAFEDSNSSKTGVGIQLKKSFGE